MSQPFIYTVETANKALVLIRPITTELVGTLQALENAKRILRREKARSYRRKDPERERAERLAALEREVETIEAKVEELKGELEQAGVVVRDPFEKGLIDFPGHVDEVPGELVYLCWVLGEPSVNHWHAINGPKSGYSDRQKIEPKVKQKGAHG